MQPGSLHCPRAKRESIRGAAVSSTTEMVAEGPSACRTHDDAVMGPVQARFQEGAVTACEHSAEALRPGHAWLCVRGPEEMGTGMPVSEHVPV